MKFDVTEMSAEEFEAISGLSVSSLVHSGRSLPYVVRYGEDGSVLVMSVDIPKLKAMGDRRREQQEFERRIEAEARANRERAEDERRARAEQATAVRVAREQAFEDAYRPVIGVGRI